MFGTKVNKLGKKSTIKSPRGPCIFPFKFKWEEHNKCVDTPKGEICATSLTPRGTLKTYGYCKKGTKNKELKKEPYPKTQVVSATKPKRYNEEFIDVLEELQTFMLRKGDVMRARAQKGPGSYSRLSNRHHLRKTIRRHERNRENHPQT